MKIYRCAAVALAIIVSTLDVASCAALKGAAGGASSPQSQIMESMLTGMLGSMISSLKPNPHPVSQPQPQPKKEEAPVPSKPTPPKPEPPAHQPVEPAPSTVHPEEKIQTSAPTARRSAHQAAPAKSSASKPHYIPAAQVSAPFVMASTEGSTVSNDAGMNQMGWNPSDLGDVNAAFQDAVVQTEEDEDVEDLQAALEEDDITPAVPVGPAHSEAGSQADPQALQALQQELDAKKKEAESLKDKLADVQKKAVAKISGLKKQVKDLQSGTVPHSLVSGVQPSSTLAKAAPPPSAPKAATPQAAPAKPASVAPAAATAKAKTASAPKAAPKPQAKGVPKAQSPKPAVVAAKPSAKAPAKLPARDSSHHGAAHVRHHDSGLGALSSMLKGMLGAAKR